MWWQIINNLKEYNTLSVLEKTIYIFANGMLLLPSCALIIFADSPLYQTYSDPENINHKRKMQMRKNSCLVPVLVLILFLTGCEQGIKDPLNWELKKFTSINQEGKEVGLDNFKGKVWMADFAKQFVHQ